MVKKKSEQSGSMGACMSSIGSKELLHTVLAGVILLLLLTTNATWANVIVLVAAAVIFISGVLSCLKACKK